MMITGVRKSLKESYLIINFTKISNLQSYSSTIVQNGAKTICSNFQSTKNHLNLCTAIINPTWHFGFATSKIMNIDNAQINKTIIDLGKDVKKSQEYTSYFNNMHQHFNLINYTTFLKHLISFTFNRKGEVADIHKKCHNHIIANMQKLPFRTFCIYLQTVVQDNYLTPSFIDKQKRDLITQYIITNFYMFSIEQCAKSLRQYKKILKKQEQEEQWAKLLEQIQLSKFLNVNYQDGIGEYFTKYTGSLNELLYLYDALDDKPSQNQKQNLQQVNAKISRALFGIETIIQKKLQSSSNPYGLPAMVAYLKKHLKKTSNVQYIQNIIKNVLVDLEKCQRVEIKSSYDLTSLLQMCKISSDQQIVENNAFILKIVEDFLLKSRKKLPVSDKFDYSNMIKQLGVQFQDPQLKRKNNLSFNSETYYYLEGMICPQINIIMNFYTTFNCWNAQIFSLLQQTFFYLLNKNSQKKYSQINAKNISIYCIQRSKIGTSMLGYISRSGDSQGSISQKNRVSISLRMQIVRKSHKEFFEKIIDHLHQNQRQYKQSDLKQIIQNCQIFHLQSRKLKKKLAQLQQVYKNKINQ